MESIHDGDLQKVLFEKPINYVANISGLIEIVACMSQGIENFMAEISSEVKVQGNFERLGDKHDLIVTRFQVNALMQVISSQELFSFEDDFFALNGCAIKVATDG